MSPVKMYQLMDVIHQSEVMLYLQVCAFCSLMLGLVTQVISQDSVN